MKKVNALILALSISLMFLTVVAVLTPVSTFAQFGDLVCEDLTGCTSAASCGGPGEPSGCDIDCEGGALIICPEA